MDKIINEDILRLIKKFKNAEKVNLFPKEAQETAYNFGLWYLSIRKIDKKLAEAYLGTSLVSCITFNCKNFDEAIKDTKKLFEKVLKHIEKIDKQVINLP